jgi:hypothetical protein
MVPASDTTLQALLHGRSINETADVIDLMGRIDALLSDGDGLKSFNFLYRTVTQAVAAAQGWEDAAWILRLDVLFADLYFDGVESCLAAPHAAPAAWRVLMERRFRREVSPVQFALAGLNAHINRDLALAVVRTWLALGPADHGRDTPEFRDYQRINAVLDAVQPGAVKALATGLFAVVDDLLAPVDGWAAMSAVHAARDLAFTNAQNLAAIGLDTDEARALVATIDAVAAEAGLVALATLG